MLKIIGYSHLNSSTLNQVLGISIKKICLSLSDVVVSLRRALLVEALGEISWLDKPTHHVKVGFMKGDNVVMCVCAYSLPPQRLLLTETKQ